MVLATTPLIGFSGEIIWPMGKISLLVKIGDEEHSTSTWMNFMVVRSPSPYNRIIGRPRVRKIQAVSSTAHGMLKFLVSGGIVTLQSSKIIPIECTMVLGSEAQPSAITRSVEERIKVAIHSEYPEQTIAIGSTLTEEGRKELCGLLRRNLDIFAWKLADLTGVPRHIAKHRLNFEERQSDLPTSGRQSIPKANWQKFGEKSLPFFKTLKKCTKKSDFQWTAKAETSFKQMKKLIAELPTLTAPAKKEELIVYLSAAGEAISTVLMTEREGKQMQIYFVSRTLQGPEINYIPMEKLVLALVNASKRLKRYFQAHPIIVITDQPIKQILSKLEVAGRLFDATNNEAEYKALIAGLRIAEQMGIKNLQAHVDSRLVANQVNGSYIAKESGMIQYLEKVKALTGDVRVS
ncbi:reverse transcriptase domain-containing protein [Tanacetum coccineum]